MKRIIILMLVGLFSICLCACGNETVKVPISTTGEAPAATAAVTQQEEDEKPLAVEDPEPTAEEIAVKQASIAIGKEAVAFLKHLDSLMALGGFQYADIMDMDNDGTYELITACDDLESRQDNEVYCINISIWQYIDNEIVEVANFSAETSLGTSSSEINLIEHGANKLLNYSYGKLSNGFGATRSIYISPLGVDAYYTNTVYYNPANNNYEPDKTTYTINDMEVSEEQYAQKLSQYNSYEKNIEIAYGEHSWKQKDYNEATVELQKVKDNLIKLIVQGVAAEMDITYPVIECSEQQLQDYKNKLEMMTFADLQGLGLFDKNDATTYGKEIMHATLAGHNAMDGLWDSTMPPKATKLAMDDFAHKTFGIQNADDIFGPAQNGYYTDPTNGAAGGFGYSLPQPYGTTAYKISEELVLMVSIGIESGWDGIEDISTIYMLLHKAQIDGKQIMQVYAYNKGQKIPQSLIDNFVDAGC
ncbi:MAG: hypothetical protein VB100_08860 [Angelakisella sp.]|nr:hypothetical protein [Angelakisella sp.]